MIHIFIYFFTLPNVITAKWTEGSSKNIDMWYFLLRFNLDFIIQM